MRWDPGTYKLRYLPADKVKVESLTDELVGQGLIRLYAVDEVTYADIPGFTKNQVINNRENESTIPEFSLDATLTRESGVKAEGRKEGKEGREGTHTDANACEPEKFSALMKAYPKRQGTNPRTQALKAWHAAIKRGGDPDRIIAAAALYARSEVAGTRYCMQTVTWLNGDCWAEAGPVDASPAADDAALWVLRLNGWKRARIWDERHGPAPGQPGCRVPRELMEMAA